MTVTWAAITFITSLPGSAGQAQSLTRSVSVDYSDLDLTRARGVSTLQHRVNGAIRQVCDRPAFGLNEKLQKHACERSAQTTVSRSVQNNITNARQLPSAESMGPVTPSAPVRLVIQRDLLLPHCPRTRAKMAELKLPQLPDRTPVMFSVH